MKSIIVYSSYTGNTKQVADLLHKYLSKNGTVDTLELKDTDEAKGFFGQCFRAFFRKKAQIEPINFDLSGYDVICIGTPVWAFAPVPAINTYITRCFGAEGKKVVLFTTYGSGTGNQRCLDYMEDIFAKKSAKQFKRFSMQQSRVKDESLVMIEIQKTVGVL